MEAMIKLRIAARKFVPIPDRPKKNKVGETKPKKAKRKGSKNVRSNQ